MKVEGAATLKDKTEKEDIFLQVVNTEKQFLTSIHSKGLLHKDSQELYRKVRAGYERVILSNHDVIDLHEVEYFLWKLHYKHIDEFRKRIRQCSFNSENIKAEKDGTDAESIINRHVDGFKSFLSEATEFYKNLIKKFREICGLPGEFTPFNRTASSVSVESTKLEKCHYLCHRFLICLGDLARYSELYKKQDAQKWSVAFTCYLKATRVCPESGNPHNQLALLGRYVGDAFLALYHCIRSLAVKEPFPDACNNLLLLFEENISDHLQTLTQEARFDISKPSEIISLCRASHAGNVSSDNNNLDITNCDSAGKTELWPLLVRLTSFFLVGCSLDDFPCILSSAVKHLEAMMALDDEQLTAALESYNQMDSTTRGPYRAVQLVSVFIFILFNQTTNIQREKLNLTKNEQQSAPTELALIATFICMGHLLRRCLKGKHREQCPLLPAVLVFMEWLVEAFERVEVYSVDEKVMIAMSYFFHALANFLNHLSPREDIAFNNNALWEDHELRGFEPIGHAHSSLDFTTDQEWTDSITSMNQRRHRIFCAGAELLNRSSDNRHWIFFDERERIFISTCWMEILGKGNVAQGSSTSVQVKEPQEEESRAMECREKNSPGELQLQRSRNGQSIATEEEEVIVFKPIMRYNSEPLCKYVSTIDDISADGLKEQILPAEECLRRAASMFTGENQIQTDGPSFLADGSSYNKQFKQQEPWFKDSVTCPAGPPSLNAWVFDREGSNFEPEKGILDFDKRELSPIPELAAEGLNGLSINETKGALIDSLLVSAASSNLPPTYIAPVPSAPILPDDAIWFRGNSSTFQDYRSTVGTREPDGILGASPVSGYPNVSAARAPLDFSPVLPGLVHGYPPLLGMSSSEWLYHYRNNHKLEQSDSPIWPVHLNGPGPLSTLHTNDISRFDLFSPWGNNLVSSPALYMEGPQLHPGSSLVYGTDEQRRDNLLSGYQRSSPYVCGAGTETRPEQQSLLQYLKQKEWYLQREPQLRGTSAFMGN